MSVNILSDVEKWVAVAYEDKGDGNGLQVKPEAYAFVVLGSRSIGLDVLDESTAEKWFTRLRAIEVVYGGPFLYGPKDPDTGRHVPVWVTREALVPFYGTRTNCFPAMSDAKFATHMGKVLLEELKRRKGEHGLIVLPDASPADESTDETAGDGS